MNGQPLCIGVKRGVFRANDASATAADKIFEGVRTAALQKHAYRCVRCFYESTENRALNKPTSLQVHHSDDDHSHNDLDNLEPHCSLDHAYHHVGCSTPSTGGAFGWANKMVIAYAPELSAEDCNQLQRAVGAAMLDGGEEVIAKEILDLLSVLALPVKDGLGTYKANDFADAFSRMTPKEYAGRAERVGGMRILFHPDILKKVGGEMLQDAPMWPVKSWGA